MKTVSTPISDLKKDDKVLHYGSIFLVTSDVKYFEHGGGVMVPACTCKRIETVTNYSGIDGLLAGYDSFQGFWNVAKIID